VKLESFVGDRWVAGSADGRPFGNPVTGAVLGTVDDTGIEAEAVLAHARSTGLPALAALTFAQRGEILKAIADVLVGNREKYFDIARLNSGNTAVDAAIDVDGAIGTLRVYARYGKLLGMSNAIAEAGEEQLTKEPVFFARHIWTTRPGVALQINAFNFPSWGLWEKVAGALLSGVPSVCKPASATAWLAHEMMRDVAAAKILPPSAISLICGSGKGLSDALETFDSLAFTGSAETALGLRSTASILRSAPRISIEADSINATIVGPDARPGSDLFELAVREVIKALTVKAGQLCTNIRRIFVAGDQYHAFTEAVASGLKAIVVGDPAVKEVAMGPLVNAAQRNAAIEGINRLKQDAVLVTGGGSPDVVQGADASDGAFVAPTLLACSRPSEARAVHEIEVFGPCSTVMPYQSIDDAISLGARGGGSLALSVFSNDTDVHKAVTKGLAAWHGRVMIVDEEVGRKHTGHAIAMPQCVHGGPGRAGGGEELGGLRALHLHMQRTAIQASPSAVGELCNDMAPAAL